MKNLILLFVGLVACHICSAQILYLEDFNGMSNPVPTSVTNTTSSGPMTTFDVDGLTPVPTLMTDAWVAQDSMSNPGLADTVAVSTSWYSPAGTSDDWMVTPAIVLPAGPNNLSWDARAFDVNFADGYEVWISTTTPTVAGLLAGTLAFSTPAESTTWIARMYDLTALSGSTIYIGFRNNSTDQNLLLIDDIKVEMGAIPDDAAIVDVNGEYTAITLVPNRGCPADIGCEVENLGTSASNVTVLCNIYRDSVSVPTLMKSMTSDVIASLPAGIDSSVTFQDSFIMISAEFYIFEYIVTMTEVDTNNSNDTAYAAITVTNEFMARDNGQVTGTLGIGAGIAGILGQNFDLKNPDRLLSVEAFLGTGAASATAADTTKFVIYSTLADGTPDALIAETPSYTLSASDTNAILNIPFDSPVDLPAGTYFVGMTESDLNITLGTSSFIYTPGEGWVIFGANPWRNSEAYGFFVSYVLRPQFEPCPDSMILASVITGNELNVKYEVDSFISSIDVIEMGATNVLYDAGDHINLNQGFTVELGAEFEAVIDGCGGARYARKRTNQLNFGALNEVKSFNQSQTNRVNSPLR